MVGLPEVVLNCTMPLLGPPVEFDDAVRVTTGSLPEPDAPVTVIQDGLERTVQLVFDVMATVSLPPADGNAGSVVGETVKVLMPKLHRASLYPLKLLSLS